MGVVSTDRLVLLLLNIVGVVSLVLALLLLRLLRGDLGLLLLHEDHVVACRLLVTRVVVVLIRYDLLQGLDLVLGAV